VVKLGVILALGRLLLALALKSADAQWQLNYIPIWLIDLPWSGIYFWLLPFPIGEFILGPIWWGSLPWLLWRWRHRRRRKAAAAP
jgi:hypothetical protein